MGGFLKGLLATSVLLMTSVALAADPAAPASAAAPAVPVAAAPVSAPAGVPQASSTLSSGVGGQLLQLVLGLLLVVGLIFTLAWLMRRVQRAGPAGNQVIELVGSRAMGPRDRLVLVQIGTEQVLLGVSPGSITALHVMKEPVHVKETQNATPEFAKRLMEVLGNRGTAGSRQRDDSPGNDSSRHSGPKDKH